MLRILCNYSAFLFLLDTWNDVGNVEPTTFVPGNGYKCVVEKFFKVLWFFFGPWIPSIELFNWWRSFFKFYYIVLANEDGDSESKMCGKILVVLSWILVIATMPFSLFICFKVSFTMSWQVAKFIGNLYTIILYLLIFILLVYFLCINDVIFFDSNLFNFTTYALHELMHWKIKYKIVLCCVSFLDHVCIYVAPNIILSCL